MIIYHPTKFGYKKISSLEDMVATVMIDYMSPHLDPKLEDSKPIFHETQAQDDASPHRV